MYRYVTFPYFATYVHTRNEMARSGVLTKPRAFICEVKRPILVDWNLFQNGWNATAFCLIKDCIPV